LRVPPIRRLNGDSPLLPEIRRLAAKKGVVMTSFSGSLDELIQLDYPALIAVSPGHEQNGYLLALTGARDGSIIIAPPLLGRTAFAKSEFLPLWSGRAWILWRNSENIPATLEMGATGPAVRKFQGLLRKAGFSGLKVNGIYDAATVGAVREFQVSRGIKVTGKTGPYTLIHLYRAAYGAAAPRLSKAGKEGRL
jgi:general secretion pathway protein A